MSYKNGTYVAFNGCGTTDPTNSDIKYFNLLKAWSANEEIEFTFINSHDKTSQVKDSSKKETLMKRLMERMSDSKNLLIIITENSSDDRGLLNWEIGKCVETYHLPVIVAYTIIDERVTQPSKYKKYWPEKLKKLIEDEKVKTIHIPFKKEPILEAINKYTPKNQPTYIISRYKDEKYDEWKIK